MKQCKHLLLIAAVFIAHPMPGVASTSGGSALSSHIGIVDKIQMATDWATGPVLLALGSLFGVIAFMGMMKSKANDNRAWEWLGRIAIGLVGATAVVGIVNTFFAGATI